jgi:hypothetical protein
VETSVAELPKTNAFDHSPTALITSSHCSTSRRRKCKRFKRADEYSKKNKCNLRANEGSAKHCCNLNINTGYYLFSENYPRVRYYCKYNNGRSLT